MTKAEKAVDSVLRLIMKDPRVAWYIGPFSRTYEDVTDAYAEMIGEDPAKVRKELERTLKTEAPLTPVREG